MTKSFKTVRKGVGGSVCITDCESCIALVHWSLLMVPRSWASMCHNSISGMDPSIGTFASVQRRSKFSALTVSGSSPSAYALNRD
jgi:hypothetical protein